MRKKITVAPDKRTYVVVDHDGVAWNVNKDEPEIFPNLVKAEARATEMAKASIGNKVGIYALIREAVYVGNVVVTDVE